MKIHDISVTLESGMVVWPGSTNVSLSRDSKIEDGANANVSNLSLGVHTGTHVDAPFHFLPDGSKVDKMPLDILYGKAQVVQIPEHIHEIDREVIIALKFEQGIERILIKTINSGFWKTHPKEFQTNFVGISESGAVALVERTVRLIGIDYLSIAPYKKSRPTHEVLLNSGIVIIEGLDLSEDQPGIYTLICLPLKLKDTDGAPARAILVED
jgi:arylformamidase